MVLSQSIILTLFVFYNHSQLNIDRLDIILSKKILIKGLKLLIYNFSFYFLLIVSKSIVSKFGSLEVFSHFSLSSNLVEGISLLLGAITFLFYPKLLHFFKFPHEDGG